MSFLKSNLLNNCRWIMGSDDDQPIVNEIYIGFDPLDNFIITIDHLNYYNHSRDCSTWATVERDEAIALADRLEVDLPQLPDFFKEWMAVWRRIPNASLSQVIACFKEITECLLDERCHFRIDRSACDDDRVCC